MQHNLNCGYLNLTKQVEVPSSNSTIDETEAL
jgi:hypothetical protein